MRQFDICKNPGHQAGIMPYVVVLQSDLLSALPTRVVAPLRAADEAGLRESRFTPCLKVKDKLFVLLIADMASVPLRLLESVDSVAE